MVIARRGLAGLALALLALPPALLAVALLFDYRAYLWDARVYGCALEVLATGPAASLYQGGCGALGAFWTWNHPPAVTLLLQWLVQRVGAGPLSWGYGLALLAAPGLMLWRSRGLAGSVATPLLFLLLVAGGGFVYEAFTGNMTLVIAALAGALVCRIDRGWLPFTLFAMAAALFKPHYALYLLVPGLAARSLLWLLVPAALLSLWLALDAFLHPTLFHTWLTAVFRQTFTETHFGFMKLMAWSGGGLPGWGQGGLYLLFCGGLAAWAWWVGRRYDSAVDRGFLALACATLMIPRLKEYDCLVLVPLCFWLRGRLQAPWRQRFQAVVLGLGFGLPGLWWLLRKLPLLAAGEPGLRGWVDIRWMLAVQGLFLTALLLVVVLFAAALPRRTVRPRQR